MLMFKMIHSEYSETIIRMDILYKNKEYSVKMDILKWFQV